MPQVKALKLLHFYPKLLNLYGDSGNILALKKRLEWRGIDLQIVEFSIGDECNFNDYDLFFIGGGQDKQQDLIATDLQRIKNKLLDALESGFTGLAICGGYQLLGRSFETSSGETIQGIGFFDIDTYAKPQYINNKQLRLIGNVIAKVEVQLLCSSQISTLVGFENHSGHTYIDANSLHTKTFASIVKGSGNNGMDKTEGAIRNNVIGSYLHGSLLPKNPHIADELIFRAMLSKKYVVNKHDLKSLNDLIEINAHNAALKL